MAKEIQIMSAEDLFHFLAFFIPSIRLFLVNVGLIRNEYLIRTKLRHGIESQSKKHDTWHERTKTI